MTEADKEQRLEAVRLEAIAFREANPLTPGKYWAWYNGGWKDRVLQIDPTNSSGRAVIEALSLPKLSPSGHDLEGLFFLRRSPTAPGDWNQGQILTVRAGLAVIQMHSWLDGAPTNRELVPADALSAYDLFTDEASWCAAGSNVLLTRG